MNFIVSLVLLCVGIVLIISGLAAADSIGSAFSRLFTGAPTDRTIWLLLGGVVSAIVGAVGLMRGPRSS